MKEKNYIKLGKGIVAQIEEAAKNVDLWDNSLIWREPTQYIKTDNKQKQPKIDYKQPLIKYDNVTHYWTSNNDKFLEEMKKYVKNTLGDDWNIDYSEIGKVANKKDKRTCNKRKRLEM